MLRLLGFTAAFAAADNVVAFPIQKCAGARFDGQCIKCDGGVCKVVASTNSSSSDECCASCQGHDQCDFWTFNKKQSICYLKTGAAILRKKNNNCDSGIIQTPVPAPAPPSPAPTGVKNVLFIVVDDLRPDIGAYGADFMHTPHMDQLAATGTLFQRAYVQYSFCAPSRNSFVTGRRPDSTKVWSFMDHFRERGIGENWTTLPQYFREHGFLTLGAGKIFHVGVPPSYDAPRSWDFFTAAGDNCGGDTNGWPVLEPNVSNVACPVAVGGCPEDAMIEGDGTHWCKLDRSKLKSPLVDEVTVNATISNLQRAKREAKPFFIAAGLHKPHLPFHFPSEFDIYPPASEIAPPKRTTPPEDMSLCAWHESGFNNTWDKPCDNPGEFRRAYYSSVSYTDHNIGKLLQALEDLDLASTTAVSFIGDHGWQLGEMNIWKKMTNFELGVRVPLIIRAPWLHKSPGTRTPVLAEAVDLFPTLVDLAGLPPAPAHEDLAGISLAPVLAAPPSSGTGLREYAFSQFAKASTHSKELQRKVLWDVCTTCNRNDIEAMGYSVRSDSWRLTEWVAWNQSSWQPIWSEQVGLELYDHDGDFGEDLDRSVPEANVAADSKHKDVVERLRQALRQQFAPSLVETLTV